MIDSADKRFSMVSLALPFGRVLPAPDGDFDSLGDRLQLVYLYRADNAVAPIADPACIRLDLRTLNAPTIYFRGC